MPTAWRQRPACVSPAADVHCAGGRVRGADGRRAWRRWSRRQPPPTVRRASVAARISAALKDQEAVAAANVATSE